MRESLFFALCLLTISNPTVAGQPAEHQRFQNWDTYAWFADNGQFAFCAANAEYESGTNLMVSLGCAGLLLSVDVFGHDLTPGQSMPVVLHVDEETWFSPINAEIHGEPGNNLLLVRFGWDGEAFQALRQGNRMTMIWPTTGYDFGLDGSHRALGVVMECVHRHLDGGLDADEPASWAGRSIPHASCQRR